MESQRDSGLESMHRERCCGKSNHYSCPALSPLIIKTVNPHYSQISYLQNCLLAKIYLSPSNQYSGAFAGNCRLVQSWFTFSTEVNQGDSLPCFSDQTYSKYPVYLSMLCLVLYNFSSLFSFC